MHDIDRVRLEIQPEGEAFEAEQSEFSETEFAGNEVGEVFNEMETMELASELLGVSSEAEMEQFLGSLISKASNAVGGFIRSSGGQALVRSLKTAAGRLLPQVGSALGGAIGGPQGARLGSQAASLAGNAFGLELEGLSNEDREFEVAKRFVDFAGEAVKQMAQNAPSGGLPDTPTPSAAAAALAAAARIKAPGLLQKPVASGAPTTTQAGADQGGRWIRRGNTIILLGV
jgi:hypothetical protein